jgi:hydrogenase 3 maturation protease
MTINRYDLKTDLEEWLKNSRKVVIAGIGNPIRSDDLVGVKIVQELKNKVSKEVELFECETVPESYIEPITKLNPTHVLLIDAAFLGLKPGTSKLVKPKQIINFSPITSHTLPLRVFCELIEKMTDAKIALLLIEPKNTDFGEKLSVEVKDAKELIVKLLTKILKK